MWAEGPGGVPFGWVAPKPPWGAAPRGPADSGGEPDFLWRKSGERTPGLRPGPGFLWPLVATRWVLGSLSLKRSRGYFLRDAKTDLGRIFGIKYAKKHFWERKSPNQGTYMGAVIAHPPEQCATTAKTSEWERAGHKRRGSRGQRPRRSFLRLSPEKAGLPPGVGRETTSQVLTCAGPEKTTSPPSWAGWIRKATPRDSLRPGFL